MHLWRELFIVDGHALLRRIASAVLFIAVFFLKTIAVFSSKVLQYFAKEYCSIFLKNIAAFLSNVDPTVLYHLLPVVMLC